MEFTTYTRDKRQQYFDKIEAEQNAGESVTATSGQARHSYDPVDEVLSDELTISVDLTTNDPMEYVAADSETMQDFTEDVILIE